MVLNSDVVYRLLPLPLIYEWGVYIQGLSLTSSELYLMGITVFHAGVVFAQVGNAFACRSEVNPIRQLGIFSNIPLLLGVAVEIVIIFLLIYFPPLAKAFNHIPIPWNFWLGLIMFAPILYLLEWFRKLIFRWRFEVGNHNGGHS